MTTDPSPFAPRPPELPVDDYTTGAYAADVVGERQRREGKAGRDKLRPTIERDSRINGGVYEGSYGGEAIVVDSERGNNNLLETAYADVVRAISDEQGVPDKNLALTTVFNYVYTKMRYDANAVDNIFLEKAGGVDHQKVDLNIYIKRGVGVCRHQALFAGTLLEKFVDNGILSGHVSVERNRIRRADASDVYDGHSWVRYTNSASEVYILDVAQRRLASLDELRRLRSVDGSVWDYTRPEDRHKNLGAAGLRDVDPQTDVRGIVTSWFAKE